MGSEGYRHESGMGMGTAWAQVPVGYEYGLVLLEVVPAGSHEHRAGALTCNSSPSSAAEYQSSVSQTIWGISFFPGNFARLYTFPFFMM